MIDSSKYSQIMIVSSKYFQILIVWFKSQPEQSQICYHSWSSDWQDVWQNIWIDENLDNLYAASALMKKSWWLFWWCNAIGLMEIMKTMEAPESLSSDRLHNKLRVLVVRALPHLKLWHCLDYLCHCHHLHHRDDFNDDDNDDGHLHGTELDIVLLLLLSSSPPAPLLTHRVEDAVVRPEQQRSCLLSFSFSIL